MIIILLLIFLIFDFVNGQIPSYSITMSPADYEYLYTRDVLSDEYLPAVFEYQGSVWNDAQVRFKGRTTRYYPKKPYRVRFSANNLFQSVRHLNFNSMYTDKSFLRERLVWYLFKEMGALAPHAEYAHLTINNDWKGLYLRVDRVDRYFLQNRGCIIAPMYEADDVYYRADLTIQPDSLLKLYYEKVIGDPLDYSDLRTLIETLSSTPDANFHDYVINTFDMNALLSWFAGNTLTMMGDTYNKNYFLYRDTSRQSQQWVFIPWDYDLSFGRNGDASIPYPASLLNDGFAYTFSPLSGPHNVLKDRFLNTPSLMELLRKKVDTLLQTLFTEDRLHPYIDSLAQAISYAVQLDPQKWGTYQDFLEQVSALKYYVTARRNYLLKTFINPPSGDYNRVTLRITQTNIPYHFVAYDGRQIATMWFTSFSGLDSIRIRAYTDSTPPNVPNPQNKNYVRRWLRITPFPANAQFTANLQWMYKDYALTEREVETGVQDERLLLAHYFDGAHWNTLQSSVNAFGNFVTINNITQNAVGENKHIALFVPQTYTQTWFRQSNILWQRWYDVKFVDSMNGFIAGEQGTVLKTTDGGLSWLEFNVGIGLSMFQLAIPSINNIFVVGEFGTLFRSADSGKTWWRVYLNTTNKLKSITYSSFDSLWIVGERGLLLSSFDGGETWSQSIIDSTISLNHITAVDNFGLVAVGEKGKLFVSTNSGESWQNVDLGLSSSVNFNRAVSFGGSSIWLIGTDGVVIHSSDAGNSWEKTNVPSSIALYGIEVLSENSLFVCGENGKIYYSTNKGQTWYSQYTATSYDLQALDFVSSTRGFVVGNSGTILLTTSPGTVTSISWLSADIPIGIKLFQNYPNPFNPVTTISFEIPLPGKVNLTIYDILGREVVTLIDEFLTMGYHQIQWDASKTPYGTGYSSGVYFYRLTFEDVIRNKTFIETKKLIFIK